VNRETDPSSAPRAASTATRDRHAQSAAAISFDDTGDFERATRGLIATHPTGRIARTDARGGETIVWDTARHDFLRADDAATNVPDTVHPGLWRQGRLNAIHGLFEVADGVWQARGYDISNITFIDGDDGWLIIDPLTTEATARACLELANAQLGERRVASVIYTHSHADHFGGIEGVTTREEVAAGNVRIIAPDGFLNEVVSESAIAGSIMARRAMYQFGPLLPNGPQGQVDNGLGKALPLGQGSLIAPTESVTATGEELLISGVRIVFQMTPDAEAPAEMNFHFPDRGLLCMAENCSHNLHNLYPIRGAQTRDSLAWSKYIHEALLLWGDSTDLMFASHHWPRFGADDVRRFLTLQRDVYRWMHDQAMRLANHGFVPTEIAAQLSMPDVFDQSHVQGYYGTVSHNVRSVYNRYLGWYDGNPANLDPLPPVDAGAKYVDFMGGADEVLRRARSSYDDGEYRWVVQVVNHLVFADPNNREARLLQADAMEQLGYQTESGTWRNAYLSGASELRNGSPQFKIPAGRRMAHAMEAENLMDVMGVRFDPAKFGPDEATFNWHFTDLDEHHVMGIANAAIHHTPNTTADDATASIALTRDHVFQLFDDAGGFDAAVEAGLVAVDGDIDALRKLFDSLDEFLVPALIEP